MVKPTSNVKHGRSPTEKVIETVKVMLMLKPITLERVILIIIIILVLILTKIYKHA